MRTLVSLALAGLLLGACNTAHTKDAIADQAPPSLKQEAPTIPEPGNKPTMQAFMMKLSMMCSKSSEMMNAIANVGEKPIAIWKTPNPGGMETLTMFFVHPEKKEITIMGIADTPGGQIGCMINTGTDLEFYHDLYDKMRKTPKKENKAIPGSWIPVSSN
tara:strand:- start:3 stop:482 length:480 start_codon:yes stop_codon:yes gene_type:complete